MFFLFKDFRFMAITAIILGSALYTLYVHKKVKRVSYLGWRMLGFLILEMVCASMVSYSISREIKQDILGENWEQEHRESTKENR